MFDDDFQEYQRLVESVPDGGTIMEIGVYLGGSLACLAPIIKRKGLSVIAVDVFDAADYDEPNVMEDKKDMQNRFLGAMVAAGIAPAVTTLNRTHEDIFDSVLKMGMVEKFDLVFVDGDHSYQWAKKDIDIALNIIRQGGVIAGHDYDDIHPGVVQAVREAFGNKVFVKDRVWSVRP